MITDKITGTYVLPPKIYKFVILVALLLSFPVFGADMTLERKTFLVGKQGEPKPALTELLTLLHERSESTLPSIVKTTQENWFQRGKERWQFEERYTDKKEAAWPLLTRLGCIEKVGATKMQYDYLLLLGGYPSRMQDRIQFLIQEWNRGVRFKQLVMLTGERPLDLQNEKGS